MRIMMSPFADKSKWTVDIEVPADANSAETLDLLDNPKQWTKCIAFTGQFNVGKTMLLSMLCGRPFPSGDNVSTDGISIAFVKDKGLMLLDSAGTDHVQPEHFASLNSDSAEETRENFVSEVVMEMSSVFVHVVAKLTRPAMRRLWGHLASIQMKKRSDLTVLYNLYPHEENMAVVKKQVQDIVSGYGNAVDFSEEWSFITNHDGVQVHHWFFLSNNWRQGREINKKQLHLLWPHLLGLAGVRQEKSTRDVVERTLKNIIPSYVVPSGCCADVLFQKSSEDSGVVSSRDYKLIGKFEITLPPGALMQNPKLFLDGSGRLKPGNDGFHPAVRIFEKTDKSEHVILIDATNCVFRETAAPGQGQIIVEEDCHRGNFSCTRIEIKKELYLQTDLGKSGDDEVAEDAGVFEMFYPPAIASTETEADGDVAEGNDVSLGPLTFRSAEYINGMLIVRMERANSKQSR